MGKVKQNMDKVKQKEKEKAPVYRRWCYTCQEWKIFKADKRRKIQTSGYYCSSCKTEDSGFAITDVPVEKRLEQQERFVLQQKIVLDFDKKSTLSQVVKKYKKTENQILEILSIIEDDADFIRWLKLRKQKIK